MSQARDECPCVRGVIEDETFTCSDCGQVQHRPKDPKEKFAFMRRLIAESKDRKPDPT